MSDALNYLVKVRPDAIGPYLAFLKEAGRHLDPKTRNLISVITKVHSQTQNGFRQYLGRALREGATPDEILDAFLMAFPALGLAKIIWAIDIILEMKIPGFDPARMGAGTAPEWHDVVALADLPADGVRRLEVGDRGLFVLRTPAGIRVYDSLCPHQATNIPELAIQGRTLTCPKHEWAFDLATGDCIAKGTSPLNRLEHRVTGDLLEVRW
ncbi:MAG: Rieske 2Fe-2S domain-containing protein [Betaproteobacteria bacterium]|nr:Rieske 2Fe-2S domain-containing protein [Betaproteobacteria bacterium]